MQITFGRFQSLHKPLPGSLTLHATPCNLQFDKYQKNEIHSLTLCNPQAFMIVVIHARPQTTSKLPYNACCHTKVNQYLIRPLFRVMETVS